MLKNPNLVPTETSTLQLVNIVEHLRGFQRGSEATSCEISAVKSIWKEEYAENLEKVMFDNLASYEP
jgi:hypothetical protein